MEEKCITKDYVFDELGRLLGYLRREGEGHETLTTFVPIPSKERHELLIKRPNGYGK